MDISKYTISINLPYEELTKKYSDEFEEIYTEEISKKWIVPIEEKLLYLNKLDQNKIQHIENVIYKLKKTEKFVSEDIEILSTFISNINSIVNIGNRLNNFKHEVLLENDNTLDLVTLFNEISEKESLSKLNIDLNKNLTSLLPNVFSVIKHCQDPNKYPIYYKIWKNISTHVLGIKNDYDTMCSYYQSFPKDNRTTRFGAYFALIAQKLLDTIEMVSPTEVENFSNYLKKKVLNIEKYQLLIEELNTNKNSSKNFWLYQPGENAFLWESCLTERMIRIGWDALGDLSSYQSKEDIVKKLLNVYDNDTSKSNDATANWDFYNTMQIGDVIIVKKGVRKLLGYGIVTSDYKFDPGLNEYKSIREINWIKSGEWNLNFVVIIKTLTNITNFYRKNTDQKLHEYLISMIDNTDVTSNKYLDLLKYKKQIILQGPPGTGKTREAELIAKEILDLKDVKDLENNEQFNIIQFHPSYSYEDFVRGIMAKPNNDSKGIIYETENKIFAEFAARAHANYEDSQKDSETISKEFSLKELFENFKGEIQDRIDANNGYYSLTDNVGLITSFDEDAFRYKGTADGWLKGGNRMLFKDITKAFSDGNSTRQDIKQNPSLSGLARQHASYFVRVLNLFQKYVDENQVESTKITQVPLQNFVFIIDEINRANLSSVLGELIYALEYRGKSLDGMYKVDGNNKIILPPNLYIIGTMNTADRSVGHIDYAIRRRFAFADVLPKDLTNELEKDQFYTDLFKRVQLLFIKEDYENRSDYLESDFDPKDVALGHSYFIDQSQDGGDINMRWQYEIKPILLEYVRDGILKESALNEIMEIEKSLA